MTERPENRYVPDMSGTSAGFCAGFFAKKPNEINDVPDVPDSAATFLMRAHAHASASRANFLLSHGYIPRHIRHIRHIVDLYRYFEKKGGTVSGTKPLNPAQPSFGEKRPSKTIVCTPENAREFQQVVRAWPELHALVQGLQADDLFPGLRAMRITLTGSEEQRAQGLAALLPENAPEGRK